MKAIASHNGRQALEEAMVQLTAGAAPLDACVEGVTVVEDDPRELTVGYGSLPNEDGVVQLDAAVMDGPTHRGGAVAALEGIRHPTKVARLVMQQTNRVMLVGQGALRFALANGFQQEDLLTQRARQMWLYWKRDRSPHDDWLPVEADQTDLEVQQWFEKHFYGSQSREGSQLATSDDAGPDPSDPDFSDPNSSEPSPTGTVHCAALSDGGDLACATSTGGHAFKMSGRVGDSPVLGAGLYVDNEVGSCGSIGHGEANLENLSSFAAVELMRGGLSPVEAGLEVLRRIAQRAHPWQRDDQGRPKFNVQLFLLAKDGSHAGVAMWGLKQMAVADGRQIVWEDCLPLLERDATAK